MSKPEEFKFDSRVRDRFLRSRVLSSTELQKHLDQLPDLEGEYEVLNDTPQPAVTPPRSEVNEEPLVFDGIRRLQALSEASSAAPPLRHAPPPPPPSNAQPSYREPERPLGTPLRSALMESEISGVGAGAVSAALGAMAAEARGASVFGVPSSMPQPAGAQPSISQPSTLQPSTLQPSTLQPSISQPSTLQPSAPQPSISQPSTLQPSAPQPSISQPAVSQMSAPVPSISQTPLAAAVAEDVVPPVTLRSDPTGQTPVARVLEATEDVDDADEDLESDEDDDEDDLDDEDDEDDVDDEDATEDAAEDDAEDAAEDADAAADADDSTDEERA